MGYKVDCKKKNHFWRNDIKKEMLNAGVAFELLSTGKNTPPGWKGASGHIILNVKMDFTRKTR